MKNIALIGIALVAGFQAAAQAPVPAVASLGTCAGGLKTPTRVAVGPSGRIYVSDPQLGQVGVYDSFFRRILLREGFARPLGIAVDQQEHIFLAEEEARCVSVFDSDWNLLYKLGRGEGEFQLPNHIAVTLNADEPTIYVSDSQANEIKVFSGPALVRQFGIPGTGNQEFDFPAGVCVSTAGELFVVDQGNDRVQVFDAEGNFRRAFPLGSNGTDPSGRAQAVLVDSLGRLFVADTFQGVVKVFDAESGTSLTDVGSFGQLPGQLASPAGLALDTFNRLFVSSASTRRVEVYGIDSFLHVALEPAGALFASGTDLVLRAMSGAAGPLVYQWRKDGVDLPGATEATYTLPSLSSADAGAYSVVISGSSGNMTSDSAQVQVLTAPSITNDPESLTVFRGSNVVLQVGATGANLGYQWLLNGRPLENASAGSLSLPNVQPHQAGTYSVVISNAVGIVTSTPALLTVLTPPTTVEIVAASIETDGLFHLTLNADPGFTFSLDASGDLSGWGSLGNFSNEAGLVDFIDSDSTNWVNRFYRLRWLP